MARKRVLLLANDAAGTGTARSRLFSMISYLALRNCEVTVYPILPAQGLTSERILRECRVDYDLLICCGGDGTLNHVVNDLMHQTARVPIAYFPTGSTNDFARSLGIPTAAAAFCETALNGRAFAFDIGRFNDRYFNYIAAFGAFTKVSYSTAQDLKNALGYVAYVLEGILTLPESISCRCHMRICHDGETEEGYYLYGAVSNATSVGGIKSPAIRQAQLDDGVFEVVLIRAPENLKEVSEIAASLTSGSLDARYVRVFSASDLEIEALSRIAWTLDGEYGGEPEHIHIAVCPKAMEIMLPPLALDR